MMIFKDGMYLQNMHWHSLVTIPKRMNTQFNELSIHSHMNARTISWYSISQSPGSNLALRVIWIAMTRTDGTNEFNYVGQAEKN